MRKPTSAALAVLLAGMSAAAAAHHSGAMFDSTKLVEVDGTVKEFQWTNPHSWLQIMTSDGKGGTEEWSLELGPLVVLSRAGWKPRTLQPGDKVKVAFHPMRDGSHGGKMTTMTLPDGQVFEGQPGAPPTLPGAALTDKAAQRQ